MQTNAINEKLYYHDIPILKWDVLKDNTEFKVILVASYSSQAVASIKALLDENVEKIEIYDCKEFIENNLIHSMHNEGKKYCPICDNRFDAFVEGGLDGDLFKKHRIIGGGIRKNCYCPFCESSDRERWLNYVIREKTDIMTIEGRLLHFAPEKETYNMLSGLENIDYYSGDIESGKAMYVIDITNIQFKDSSFDYLICNHVLEHVSNLDGAMREINRVLKTEGVFVFLFPICLDMDTYVDAAIDTPEKRVEYYGQVDHVRLFGRDYKKIFEKYGFEIREYVPHKVLANNMIEEYGLTSDDIIIVGKRKQYYTKYFALFSDIYYVIKNI